MIGAPLKGRVLLSPAALRDRQWQAYAYALNTDEDEGASPKAYRRFIDELRDLHEGVCGQVFPAAGEALEAAFAFAERWHLRRLDVWTTCQQVEMHDRPGTAREDALHLQLPLIVYDVPAGLSPVEVAPASGSVVYDLTKTTPERLRHQVATRYKATMRAIEEAEKRWARDGLMVRVPAHHADPGVLSRLARRWVRRVKGWTLPMIAEAEGVDESTIESSLRTWRKLDQTREAEDARFRPED